LSSA
jgi:hypothetical protein